MGSHNKRRKPEADEKGTIEVGFEQTHEENLSSFAVGGTLLS
jgi:hypothetical protein